MKRILIIEDNEQTLNDLKIEFEKSGLETICCSDFDSAQKAVESDIPFDVVILDWFFVLPESSEFSLQILKKLKQKCFVPVFVYTGHLPDFENKSEDELGYPKNIIIGKDKAIKVEELKEQINSLLNENITLKIAKAYRNKINKHLEKIFFELNESENSSLVKVLRTIYGDGNNIDWNNDVILTMLHRSLITDDSFTDSVTELLKNTSDNNTNNITDDEFNRKLINKIVYHRGKSDYIRNGDIIRIKGNNNEVLSYGIIVTPDCDLEQSKTQLIEIVELASIDDQKLSLNNGQKENIKKYNHDSFFLFPAVTIDGTLIDLVAIFKSKFILKEKDIAADTRYPIASKRLLYSQSFVFNRQEVKLEFLCSKVNPYKAEFLQKLQAHNTRVGIPDIKNLL